MLARVLTFALFTTYVIAEVPSYMHVCGRRNPNLDGCIINSANDMKSKLCQGIPEIDIPPLESLVLPPLTLSETNNVKLYVKDVHVIGVCGFVINDAHLDLDKLKGNMNIQLNNILINSTYDFDIHILVALISKGPCFVSMGSINVDIQFDLKKITKNGKEYLYMSKILTNIVIKNSKIKFEINDSNKNQLQEIIANFVGGNQEELLITFTPALEEAISKLIISTFNNVLKHFTYDELFPDQV